MDAWRRLESSKDLLHWSAGCLPQEQVASFAHTHSPLLRPQQAILIVLICGLEGGMVVGEADGIMVDVRWSCDAMVDCKTKTTAFFIPFAPAACSSKYVASDPGFGAHSQAMLAFSQSQRT